MRFSRLKLVSVFLYVLSVSSLVVGEIEGDKVAVKKVAKLYIKATCEGDGELFNKIFHPAIAMNGYLGDQIVVGNAAQFLDQMTNNPSLKESGAPY